MRDQVDKTTVPVWIENGRPRAGRAPLMLLHGISGGSLGWTPQLQWLGTRGWRALAWDMPGYGHSEMQSDYSFPRLADALLRTLDAARVERAILIGHSMGGMVALQAWSQFPERIAGLVLAATSPAFGHGSGDFIKRFLAQRLALLDMGLTMAQAADTLIPAMAAPDSTVAEHAGLARAYACMTAIAPATYRSALASLVNFEQRAALPTIRVPTLCLAAEHDKIATPSMMQRMAGQIPGGLFAQISGAGHLLNFERPEAFNAALSTFLATLDE